MSVGMIWRCAVCKRPRQEGDVAAPLTRSLTDRYRTGKCIKCRTKRYFEPFTPEVWKPLVYDPTIATEFKPSNTEKIIPAGVQDEAFGDRLKEKGMGRAELSEEISASGWNARADAAIRALALLRIEFTSEDVTKRVGLPARSTGAVGARMNAAARRGIIKWTGRMVNAKRPNQHSALLKQWRGA